MSGNEPRGWPGTLDGTTVHLWLIDTKSAPAPGELISMLSPAELARAERLAPAYRDSYRLQRIIMRKLIGRYLAVAPDTITFGIVSNGKPCLTGSLRDSLYFNVSDTGKVIAAGFTVGGPIGVDMELPGRAINTTHLARRICTDTERTSIAGLPPEALRNAVLRLWVRKEAVLKGLGHGLKTPMRLLSTGGTAPVEVAFDPTVPDVTPGDRWFVTDIETDGSVMVSAALPFPPEPVTVIPTIAYTLIGM